MNQTLANSVSCTWDLGVIDYEFENTDVKGKWMYSVDKDDVGISMIYRDSKEVTNEPKKGLKSIITFDVNFL